MTNPEPRLLPNKKKDHLPRTHQIEKLVFSSKTVYSFISSTKKNMTIKTGESITKSYGRDLKLKSTRETFEAPRSTEPPGQGEGGALRASRHLRPKDDHTCRGTHSGRRCRSRCRTGHRRGHRALRVARGKESGVGGGAATIQTFGCGGGAVVLRLFEAKKIRVSPLPHMPHSEGLGKG